MTQPLRQIIYFICLCNIQLHLHAGSSKAFHEQILHEQVQDDERYNHHDDCRRNDCLGIRLCNHLLAKCKGEVCLQTVAYCRNLRRKKLYLSKEELGVETVCPLPHE